MDDDDVEAVYVDDVYDPVTCVTAGELRSRGFPVPEDVPDCGWVPRTAVKTGVTDNYSMDPDGRFHTTIEVSYMEAFRWVEATFTVGKAS
jgi:hypothetical protein